MRGRVQTLGGKVAEPPACISGPDKAHLGLPVMKGARGPVPLSFVKTL